MHGPQGVSQLHCAHTSQECHGVGRFVRSRHTAWAAFRGIIRGDRLEEEVVLHSPIGDTSRIDHPMASHTRPGMTRGTTSLSSARFPATLRRPRRRSRLQVVPQPRISVHDTLVSPIPAAGSRSIARPSSAGATPVQGCHRRRGETDDGRASYYGSLAHDVSTMSYPSVGNAFHDWGGYSSRWYRGVYLPHIDTTAKTGLSTTVPLRQETW